MKVVAGYFTVPIMAITTIPMMKRVFNLPLWALQGFVDSTFYADGAVTAGQQTSKAR
ncbi:hypothetical protein KCO_13427 [Pectobacterium brasiliense ICMP 19477]|nr:hypothetical protein KCO_13427 [Pectobacterium brasiliense ICMP 19477]